MTIKEAWHIFNVNVLQREKHYKALIFTIALIWFVIVIYTARHPEEVREVLAPWITFTVIFMAAGLGFLMIADSIVEKLRINITIDVFMKWLLFLILGNWALCMIFTIAAGSVIWVIEAFGI